MSTDITEKAFQEDICKYLESTGYVRRDSNSHFDAVNCLDEKLVIEFISSTQLNKWKKFKNVHKENSEKDFIVSLKNAIINFGVIEVLRNGFHDVDHFQLFFPKPHSSLNIEAMEKYNKNIFSVIDELEYENRHHGNRIDIVIFINGIPISTIELKNTFSQGVENAIKQYKNDRDPNEKIFKNSLIHFAMSDRKIFMTTKLDGEDTVFLPFNKGIKNPPAPEGFYETSYLYTEILQKDQISNLITNFIFKEKGKYIFPRFHQLDCVNYLIDNSSPNHNYLIQHSAGSGKTKTIAWLAHGLLNKFNHEDKRIYNTVFVISDRVVIDKQLQEQVKVFEKEPGTVAVIDDKKTSRDLANEIENKTNIIVTTIHKFSYIVDELKNIPDRTYAIIVDEAHSSQTGKHARNVRRALASEVLEDEYYDESDDEIEKRMLEDIEKLRNKRNLSFFAFTATPKQKTLEMFGKKEENGEYVPHHDYTMEQAIKEGFILDVLKYYLSYPTYFNIVKTVAEDEEYDKKKVIRAAKKFVNRQSSTISQKTSIILDHFNSSSIKKIPDSDGNGQARAMLVTESRELAVKYKKEFDKQIIENEYPFKTLVAFTGTIELDGIEYTEDNMNNIDKKIECALKDDPYRILIVADKYQTGFDEPLLHTMYVDKRLHGVKTVQTLSRLNRTYPNKNDTLILDFTNDPKDIQKDFQMYYGETILSEGTDYHVLYNLMGQLYAFNLFTIDEVDDFVKSYHQGVNQTELHRKLNIIISRYDELEINQQGEFKSVLRKFQNIYSFLCQILDFADLDLEKLYQFNYFLNKKLPTINDPVPFNIEKSVDLSSYTVDTEGEVEPITLNGTSGELNPPSGTVGHIRPEDRMKLSEIVKIINERYGSEFDDELTQMLEEVESYIKSDEEFLTHLKNPNNTVEDLKTIFPFDAAMFSVFEKYRSLYIKIFNEENAALKKQLESQLFNRIYSERDNLVNA